MTSSSSAALSLLFLGTGTSSALPSIGCLTDPKNGCHCCRSTLDKNDLEAQKNRRRNCSAVIRIPDPTTKRGEKTLLIDCGKTFYSGAEEMWPKHNLREIDAVLLTHAHADAILGLDDLRGWTLHKHIQASISIYCNEHTFGEISKTFPYLTDTSKATGGGDVPQFAWHVFDDTKPLDILGIRVMPLRVHHGQYFTKPPTPYWSLGFIFNHKICYISDVSNVPEETWSVINEELNPSTTIENGMNGLSIKAEADGVGIKKLKGQGTMLVIDALRIENHTSHFGLPQAVEVAQRMGIERTYLVGFGHRTSHELWVAATSSLSRNLTSSSSTPPSSSTSSPPHIEPSPLFTNSTYNGTSDPSTEDTLVYVSEAQRFVEAWNGPPKAAEEGKGWVEWCRPACDGLTVKLEDGKGVRDDVYDL